MAKIVDTTNNPNQMGFISDKALLLDRTSQINRKMNIPTVWKDLRIGMFISTSDLITGESFNPEREDISSQELNSVIGMFAFGLRNQGSGTPFTTGGKNFCGISTLFAHSGSRKCFNRKPIAGSNPFDISTSGGIFAGDMSEMPYFKTTVGYGNEQVSMSTGFDLDYPALTLISDMEGSKTGVSFCGLRFNNIVDREIRVSLLLNIPTVGSSDFYNGITDLSNQSLINHLRNATEISQTLVNFPYAPDKIETSGTQLYLDNMNYFYFRHPFKTFGIRVHNHGFLVG